MIANPPSGSTRVRRPASGNDRGAILENRHLEPLFPR